MAPQSVVVVSRNDQSDNALVRKRVNVCVCIYIYVHRYVLYYALDASSPDEIVK